MTGVKVDNLTPDILRRLQLPDTTRGVVVMSVDPDSAAAAQGIRRGDVIEEVARRPVSSVAEFTAALEKVGKGDVLLSVRNSAGVRYVVVKADN